MSIENIQLLGYLGPEGSFSHICCAELTQLIPSISLKGFSSISAIRQALNQNELTFGLFPVENSLGGSVPESLDGLIKESGQLQVLLEWVLPIEHNLVCRSSTKEIKEIRAHFQAFAQCENYLQQNYPKAQLKEFSSNSAAAESLAELNPEQQTTIAAISSSKAAKIYNLQILQKSINDSKDNCTRFWLVGKKENTPNNIQNKQELTSLAFRIPQDKPGGLMKILSCLAERNINLSKIESRPTRGRLCEYTFFVDFVNPPQWSNLKDEVLNEIKELSSYFCFLGSYSVWPLNDLRFISNQV
jgi:prephenate dehydratase